MNRSIYFLVIIFVSTLGYSCKTGDKKIKIGFLINAYNSPRWEREAKLFKERVSELGGEALIAVADGDENKQYRQAQEFIDNEVDIIVITASNANIAAAIVRRAHDKGIKVIAYDGNIMNAELDYLIGFDLEKVGELQAQYALSNFPSGNYVILYGDKVHSASTDMYEGAMNKLKPAIEINQINIVYSDWMENWSGVNAKFYSEKVFEFSGEDIDVILAANDGIADGVSEEIKLRKLNNRILLTGQDGDLAACYRILNGDQAMTVYKSSKLIAYGAVDLAFMVVRNEKPDNLQFSFNGRIKVPTVILDPVIVDKSNIESTIVKDGIYTFDEIRNYSEKSK